MGTVKREFLAALQVLARLTATIEKERQNYEINSLDESGKRILKWSNRLASDSEMFIELFGPD